MNIGGWVAAEVVLYYLARLKRPESVQTGPGKDKHSKVSTL
ncbi:hypothetical protein B0G38_001498 [Arthrobacter sp. VKM Ac-2550]|nr:hypothetical protein [Arthrobacter sp. VKM Ac-2550]